MAYSRDDFAAFQAKMQRASLPDVVIRTFEHYYRQLAQGHTGLIPESEIRPVVDVSDTKMLSASLESVGCAALPKTVMVKLNGGLGTSMGLNKAKSLLTVGDGYSFLDIIAAQALRSRVPVVLMNSYSTHTDSRAALAQYEGISGPLPLDFMQHKVPKVLRSDLSPAVSKGASDNEWCPAGHGDLYTALVTSGMLETMLEFGYEYLFVSNADNLGAVMDAAVLGHFVAGEFPFLMEVADRTTADRKGGHLAQDSQGRLILRESAQCPEDDLEAFQDIARHRYFNTNNLWINLPALALLIKKRGNVLGLPMIRNLKSLDPRDASSPAVYQLETAMGSAISNFKGSTALRVSRTRFTPVKTTNDLLSLRSDDYQLSDDFRVLPSRANAKAALVDLDPEYFGLVDAMEERFPKGPPSLVDCISFRVVGDVRFGARVECRGNVEIRNEGTIQTCVDDDSRFGDEVD
ncbi:MAG: UTP--glucose-1-phosphate uridylyltransferase [Myxococcales bacterium]|nr:UTP--glucose-1-phosphate uridylyltransferase [Myxococcales bacterium]